MIRKRDLLTATAALGTTAGAPGGRSDRPQADFGAVTHGKHANPRPMPVVLPIMEGSG